MASAALSTKETGPTTTDDTALIQSVSSQAFGQYRRSVGLLQGEKRGIQFSSLLFSFDGCRTGRTNASPCPRGSDESVSQRRAAEFLLGSGMFSACAASIS